MTTIQSVLTKSMKIDSHLDPHFFTEENKDLNTDREQMIYGRGYNKCREELLSSLTDLLHSEVEGIIMEDEDIPSVDATNQFYWEEQNDKIRERNELRASQRERLAKRIESIKSLGK